MSLPCSIKLLVFITTASCILVSRLSIHILPIKIPSPSIIFGAGGFSKSIIDSLNHKHYELIGFIDKYKSGYHQSYPILG
ncbi:hypothetical protein ACSLO3_27965, partial [Escherichia coli]